MQKVRRLHSIFCYSIETADAIVIGAGAGMSTSAGMHYDGERFERYFSDFHKKYGIRDMLPKRLQPVWNMQKRHWD